MSTESILQEMPWVIVWIHNAVWAYREILPAFIMFFVYDWWSRVPYHSLSGLTLPVFIGVISWLVYCALRYGYVVA